MFRCIKDLDLKVIKTEYEVFFSQNYLHRSCSFRFHGHWL
jgi:hypothetical protein